MSSAEFQDLIRKVESRSAGTDLMQRLTDSVIVAAELEELADGLVGHFVEEARVSGASWADIGQAMGMTRQAAQQRFVGRKARRGTRGRLFTRFADEARRLVQDTESAARAAGSDHIGTEHLIFTMTDDPNTMASRAFTALGLSVEHLREESRMAIGYDSEGPSHGHLPFAPDMKKLLELSLREAIRSEDRQITEWHIVLGMARDPKSFGGRLLKANGITRQGLETWLAEDEAER